MNTQDPLAQLRDIHLPEPISWWPPAPGWWLLSVIVFAVLFFCVRWLIKRRANNCYRREALQYLAQIPITQPNDPLTQCQEILSLLRRTAKTAYPQLALESDLTSTMLARLNQCCKSTAFDATLRQQLSELPYQANPEIPKALLLQFIDATQQWLKTHHLKNSVGGQHANV